MIGVVLTTKLCESSHGLLVQLHPPDLCIGTFGSENNPRERRRSRKQSLHFLHSGRHARCSWDSRKALLLSFFFSRDADGPDQNALPCIQSLTFCVACCSEILERTLIMALSWRS